MGINKKGIEALLGVVSKKLGTSPQELQRQLEAGQFDKALGNMNPKDAAMFDAAIKNPKIVEQLMSAPQAQALYKKLTEK